MKYLSDESYELIQRMRIHFESQSIHCYKCCDYERQMVYEAKEEAYGEILELIDKDTKAVEDDK